VWAHLVRAGQPLIAVRDQEVAPPRGTSLEIRAEGLWCALHRETPFVHWTIGLEAFAVSLDPPSDAFGAERGDRVALGLDLEWEASAPAMEAPIEGAGYVQPSQVHGEILVDEDRLLLDGSGWRSHTWGTRPWWSGPSWWADGWLDDGRSFAVAGAGHGSGQLVGSGHLVGSGSREGSAPTAVVAAARRGPRSAPVNLPSSVHLGDLALEVDPVAVAPVLVEGGGSGPARLARSLCRYEGAGGVRGVGWVGWLEPPG